MKIWTPSNARKAAGLAASFATLLAGDTMREASKVGSKLAVGYVSKKLNKKTYKKTKRSRKPKKAKAETQSTAVRSGYKGAVAGKNTKVKRAARKKVPKTSKLFVAKVQKVLAVKKNTGKFVSHVRGQIPPFTTYNGGSASGSGASYNEQLPFDTLTDGAGVTQVNAYGASFFRLFSPSRILDVASVLYNGKTATEDWQLTTTNFPVQGLKVFVKYQSASITCRNNSCQTKEIDWYECIPKANVISTALADFTATLSREIADGKLNAVTTKTYGVGPSLTRNFGTVWKYNKKTMVLAPGQTATIFIKGPSMYTYDWEMFHDIESHANISDYVKGITVDIFGILRNIDLTNTADSTTLATSAQIGHNQGIWGVTNFQKEGVIVEIKHSYVINAPDMTAEALQEDRQVFLNTPKSWAAVSSVPYDLVARASTKTETLLFSTGNPM